MHKLDQLDYQILSLYSKKTGLTLKKIGKELHAAPSTVRNRIYFLMEQGILGEESRHVNLEKIGGLHYAVLLYPFEQMEEHLMLFIERTSEVIRTIETYTRHMVIIEVFGQDTKRVLGVLKELEQFGSVEPHVIRKVDKYRIQIEDKFLESEN